VRDLAIALDHHPGALAELGEALGKAGVGIEGGGVFVAAGIGHAHFLVTDAAAARRALESAGLRVAGESEVVELRLRQDEPGQLGSAARRMADAGVGIEAQYSDHHGNLSLVVDDLARGREVAARWSADARRG
jgi:hypothetical protein